MELLSLAGLWARLGSWFDAALAGVESFVRRNPWQALAVALVLACGVLVWRGNRLTSDLAAANTTIAEIKAAQKVATDSQIHVNQLPAITSAAIARQSDATAPAYYASVASTAAAHDSIVRGGCAPSHPDMPRPDPAPPVNDRPAPAPELVSRPKPDDDLIVAAAARGAKMHQDALDMIARGVAVPDDAPAATPTQGN